MNATRNHAWPILLRRACLCCSVVAFGPAMPLAARSDEQLHVDPVIGFIDTHVRQWLSDPLIIRSLKLQNATTSRLTMADIAALNMEWELETNQPSRPLIDKAMATPLSRFLRAKEEEASGTITEMIVMDARGLNAGQSGVTSDYWQGDEDKFVKSFERGPHATFIDMPRRDESTQMLQSQVSLTIVDEHDVPIGAITVGVNLEQL